MRQFYLQWINPQTLSADSRSDLPRGISQTASAKLGSGDVPVFPLSWSHYVRLLSVPDLTARQHYEEEALRGSWSVRQLDRQIATLSFQRSRSEKAKGDRADGSVDVEIKDPVVLEFLGFDTEK